MLEHMKYLDGFHEFDFFAILISFAAQYTTIARFLFIPNTLYVIIKQ